MRPSTGAREAAVDPSGFQLTSPVLHEEHDEVIDLFILLARIGVVQALGGWDISGGAVWLARGRHSDSCDGCEVEHHVGDSGVFEGRDTCTTPTEKYRYRCTIVLEYRY